MMLEPSESKITGFGFINKDTEILCIKTLDAYKKILYLSPWRLAPADEVIVFWSDKVENLEATLVMMPFIYYEGFDIKTLEPIAVSINNERTKLWIG